MKRAAFQIAAAGALVASAAAGQTVASTGSVERFQPSVAGDAMFGVGSPAIGGHLVPKFAVIGDYAYRPLSIQEGPTRYTIVSHQLRLHLNASFALFDRVQISADMPVVASQGGESPTVAGVKFNSPSSGQAGDLRLGARLRIVGDFWDPFQFGIGGYVFVPTASAGSFAGDGAVRGEPHILVGGRFKHFTYSFTAGPTLRGASRPSSFDIRTGAAVVLGDNMVQVGPELYLSAPFSPDVLASNNGQTIRTATDTSAELLFGVKIRPVSSFVIGAAAGPGLDQGWGTPVFAAVVSLAYEPLPPRVERSDVDGDGILDDDDACMHEPGVRSDDPDKNGCPAVNDRDGDGIVDLEDACPDDRGAASRDPMRNGCPPEGDRDGDGIPDKQDACPREPGVGSNDPKKNGCPPEGDLDSDGIPDERDACPKEPGVESDDPKKNGCPVDSDGDGVPDIYDACPKEPSGPDPNREQRGCPPVQVTSTEIKINRQVRFRFNSATLDSTIDPVSDELLEEVRSAIVKHPEISLIEVQGHADNLGPIDANLTISLQRAEAVRAWLVQHGIPASKLIARGYGFKAPVAPNSSEQGRQLNRRVQFSIIRQTKRR